MKIPRTATECLESKVVLDNPRLRLLEDRVRFHNGREAVHYKVDYRLNGVGVIPLLEDGRVILGLHHRYCIGEWSWEIAAGAVEEDEDHAIAGRRELEEETGYHPSEMQFLLNYYPAPGLGNEHFYVFLAKGLTKLDKPYDNEEIYELRAVTWKQIEEYIGARKIVDGLTITALVFAHAKGLVG